MDYAESCDLRSIMRNRNIAEYQKPCLSHFMLQKPGISSGSYDPLGSKASFFLHFTREVRWSHGLFSTPERALKVQAPARDIVVFLSNTLFSPGAPPPRCIHLNAGLQITVGHQPLADQNLLMFDEISNVVGHHVGQIFYCKSFYNNDE